jgi:3-hydroxyacyl-[acyl-carrier-protein] dehydratase
MEVEIIRSSRGIYKFKARGLVDGETALEAELMCTMRSSTDASQPAGQ